MRVVVLQDDFPPESSGGAGMVAASLARAIKERGHDVRVIAATQNESLIGESVWEGVPVYRIYSAYPERWRAWKSLYNRATVAHVRRLLKEWKPDVVHAHNVHTHLSYASLKVAKKLGAKVIVTAHDGMAVTYGKIVEPMSAWKNFLAQKFRYNPFRNLYIRRTLRHVDHIVAVSEALAGFLRRHGIPVSRVVHNGINPEEWATDPSTVAAFMAAHTLAHKEVILFGGRISALKGGDALLAALPHIVQARPNAVVALLGKKNSYVDHVLARAAQRNLSQAVVSLGWLSGDERKAAYHAASIVVVPSLYLDPLPTVVLEAMACGKAVVGSPFGGLPEMIKDGVTGAIVDPRNTHAFADAIISQLSNDAMREQYGHAGQKWVVEYFSLDAQAETILSCYEN